MVRTSWTLRACIAATLVTMFGCSVDNSARDIWDGLFPDFPDASVDSDGGRDASMRMDASRMDGSSSSDAGTDAEVPLECGSPEIEAMTTELIAPDGRFERPVQITQAPGEPDTLWIAEQRGYIWLIRDGEVLDTPFLDIRSKIGGSVGDERGLLGLAFHPDYQSNRLFYVMYTPVGGEDSSKDIVAEYTRSVTSRDVAYPTENHRLLVVPRTEANHNAGTLNFGMDDFLYVTTGDGGGAGDSHGANGNSQNLMSLNGKLLRLDVANQEGDFVAEGNPALGGLPQIWAYGLRNPWRHSFDRLTGDLYIGDVGQETIEEVNVQPASSTGGENYGWRAYEGMNTYDARLVASVTHTPPVLTYRHGSTAPGDLLQLGASVTGGYVYRGKAISSLFGFYVFGDFHSRDIGAFRYCNGHIESAQRIPGLRQPQAPPFGRSELVAFGEDFEGELYMVFLTGRVLKVVPQ